MFPPEKLGEYTIVEDIAEGSFGKVKSMWDFTLFHSFITKSLPNVPTFSFFFLFSGHAYDNGS
jgi:hypothetical protein